MDHDGNKYRRYPKQKPGEVLLNRLNAKQSGNGPEEWMNSDPNSQQLEIPVVIGPGWLTEQHSKRLNPEKLCDILKQRPGDHLAR
jgi:hypothetical protein